MCFTVCFKKIGLFFKNLSIVHFFVIFLLMVWVTNYIMNNNDVVQYNDVSITSDVPPVSLMMLSDNIIKQDTEEFYYLFSQFDIRSITIAQKLQTIFTDWIKKYLVIYEIDWWLELYLKIKELIWNFIKSDKNSSIFESNNLWMYSFYYNNSSKQNTVYLVALIRWKVWAFEYPRLNHEKMQELTKSIADDLK